MLAYGAGLRVSEAVRVRLADIDRERKVLYVRQGKRKKDRQTLLSPALLEILDRYCWAARPEDLLSVVRHYELMAQKHGVQVKLNTEANARFMRSVLHRYDVAIVACGARVDREVFQAVPGAERIVDPIDVAAGRIAPGKNILIIGGGKIGLTLAESLKRQGAEVTVVEREKRIAGDVQPAFKWRHSSWVEALKIRTLTSSRVARITDEGVTVVNDKGEEVFVAADMVIATSPRKANQEALHEFEWMIDELHVCGDAVSPRGLDQAIAEGFRLGCRI